MNMYNPYIQQMQQSQDLGGLNPVYQNIAAQQAMQQQAMQQAQGLTQDAGRTVQGSTNASSLAQALRKTAPLTQEQINARDVQMGGMGTYNPYTQYNVSQQYGTDPYSQQSRMLASQEF